MAGLADLGRQPIADDKPAGAEVRDEPEFERLQAEIDKLSNPNANSVVDWLEVERTAVTLLSTKGKDLLVACYLTQAQLKTRGLPGLAAGLGVIDEMIAAYWDTIFPPLKRLRGRRNALQWMMERASASLGADAVEMQQPQEAALVAALTDRLQSIDAFLSERDPDAPSLRPLLNLVRALPVREEPPPTPEPEPAAAVVATSSTQPSPSAQPATSAQQAATVSLASSAGAASASRANAAPVVSGPLQSLSAEAMPADVERTLEQVWDRLQQVAGWLRNNDPSDARAFRFKRLSIWAGLDQLPPARDGQTQIPPPMPQLADVFARLQSGGANHEMVQFAEAQLMVFPLWLDLNRACAQALEQLGEPFMAARREVCAETARLLGRLPGLATLAFADGKPFADTETQSWLAALAGADASGATPGSGGGAEPDPLPGALTQARTLAADGQLERAAAVLQQAAEAAVRPAQRLRAHIHLAQILQAERPTANLTSFAHHLLVDVDRHGLERWDPQLALSALETAYRLLSQQERRDAAEAVLQRIVQLDAGAAVRLATTG